MNEIITHYIILHVYGLCECVHNNFFGCTINDNVLYFYFAVGIRRREDFAKREALEGLSESMTQDCARFRLTGHEVQARLSSI